MHAVLHFAECIELFGPVHTHWTFPWERMNGCMGAIPMNRHHVEEQFMRAFSRQHFLRSLPALSGDRLDPAQEKLFLSMWGEVKSAARGFTGRQLISFMNLQHSTGRVSGSEEIDAELVNPKKKQFDPDDKECAKLHTVLSGIYDGPGTTIRFDSWYHHASCLRLYSEKIGTLNSRLERSSFVLIEHQGRSMPAQCRAFLRVSVTISFGSGGSPVTKDHLFVRPIWFPRFSAPGTGRGPLDDTCHLWHTERDKWVHHEHKEIIPPPFIPIHRIRCRFVMAPFSRSIAMHPTLPPQTKGHMHRRKLQPPIGKSISLFRTCPLPQQLPS